ncbi:hypothetical protein VSDG_04716 [Cytospora chrysosperma]|uniref:PinX1-related protein 1 n=1 Tax=Cytospora chrysosperma TaxID=252740 RepID=A0A423W1W5_CYTCH|nr:hypothetical protein VSDG_04716 [Valsa sordida]
MGLAGTKNKKKWAKDPNNTAWSRNADTFGQKIMRSQGWAPGEYLGARDASHSEFYSAANASHIRAVMKDDNMGLGARRNQGDECTGLDALQDLLSRLNGRSDEAVDEDRRKREDTKITKYLSRKLGTMRFVSGGLLVGDKVQELADSLKDKDQVAAKVPTGLDGAASEEEDDEDEESAAGAKKEKKSKKRKLEDEEEQKKSKKSKKRKTDDADEDSKSKRKDKKDKKRRKERDEGDESSPGDADDAAAARKKSKKEKKEKKEKRRKAKGDAAADDDDQDSADASDPQSRKEKKKKRKADKDGGAGETTKSSTPAASGTSTPTSSAVPVPHRHLARSRFIAQKRAAVMDQAALNQIFMIKA